MSWFGCNSKILRINQSTKITVLFRHNLKAYRQKTTYKAVIKRLIASTYTASYLPCKDNNKTDGEKIPVWGKATCYIALQICKRIFLLCLE